MSVKQENEITVKVLCSNEELQSILESKGYQAGRRFTINDFYMIPKELDIKNMSTRDIIAKAVIIREICNENGIEQRITFKKKEFNDKDEILSQIDTTCFVDNYKTAIKIFENLGFYILINIKESDIEYRKDDISMALKFIENSNTLIELETCDNHDSIDELKAIMDETEIPIEKGNYFVKKVEIELNKLLGRQG